MGGENNGMTTLVGVLDKLRERKQDNEFRFLNKGLTLDEVHFFQPEELTIIKTYRFEGESNPDDQSILYLIQTNKGETGFLIDAYGVYSNEESESYIRFIRRISVEDRDEQIIFG
jgi:hypothetical protein